MTNYSPGNRVRLRSDKFVRGIPQNSAGTILSRQPKVLTNTVYVQFDNGSSAYVELPWLEVLTERAPEVGCRVRAKHNFNLTGTITAKIDTAVWQVRWDDSEISEQTEDRLDILSWPRHRPEDQVIPTPNDEESSHDVLIREVEKRKELGLNRYGTLLQPHNGRDSLQDAIEEAIDLLVYLIQVKRERDEPRASQPYIGPCPSVHKLPDSITPNALPATLYCNGEGHAHGYHSGPIPNTVSHDGLGEQRYGWKDDLHPTSKKTEEPTNFGSECTAVWSEPLFSRTVKCDGKEHSIYIHSGLQTWDGARRAWSFTQTEIERWKLEHPRNFKDIKNYSVEGS